MQVPSQSKSKSRESIIASTSRSTVDTLGPGIGNHPTHAPASASAAASAAAEAAAEMEQAMAAKRKRLLQEKLRRTQPKSEDGRHAATMRHEDGSDDDDSADDDSARGGGSSGPSRSLTAAKMKAKPKRRPGFM